MTAKEKMRGQAIVIVVLLLFVIAALIALVVDGGNAYAQRRRAQNAVDTAALSGAQELTKAGDPGVTHREVWTAIADYSEANGLSPTTDTESVDAWYIDLDGERVRPINDVPADVNKHVWDDGTGAWRDISGVEVQGALPFDTYFARILGLDSLTAHANAKAWVFCGMCSGADLFPVAVSTETFDISGTFPIVTPNIEYGADEIYVIWERDLVHPGNFGWVNWEGESPYPQGPDAPTLADNIGQDDRSGLWEVGDWVPASTGVMYSHNILESLEFRLQQSHDHYCGGLEGQPLIVPIYGAVRDPTGSNLEYQIWGFGAFYLTCVHYRNNQETGWDPGDCGAGLTVGCTVHEQESSDEKWIEGYFEKFYGSIDLGGSCSDFGLCTVKLRRPVTAPAP